MYDCTSQSLEPSIATKQQESLTNPWNIYHIPIFKYVMQQNRSIPYIYYHPQQNISYLHLTSNFPNVTTATPSRSDSDIGVIVIYGDRN